MGLITKNPSRKSEQVPTIFDTSNQWDHIRGCITVVAVRPKATCEGTSAAWSPAVLAVTWLPKSRALAQGDHPAVRRLFQLQMEMPTFEKIPRRQLLWSSIYWSGWYDWREQSCYVLTAGNAAQHYKQHPHLTSLQPSSIWWNKLHL